MHYEPAELGVVNDAAEKTSLQPSVVHGDLMVFGNINLLLSQLAARAASIDMNSADVCFTVQVCFYVFVFLV